MTQTFMVFSSASLARVRAAICTPVRRSPSTAGPVTGAPRCGVTMPRDANLPDLPSDLLSHVLRHLSLRDRSSV